MTKTKFKPEVYISLARLQHDDDFNVVLTGLTGVVTELYRDFMLVDPQNAGRIGQIQGQTAIINDVLEAAKTAKSIVEKMR